MELLGCNTRKCVQPGILFLRGNTRAITMQQARDSAYCFRASSSRIVHRLRQETPLADPELDISRVMDFGADDQT